MLARSSIIRHKPSGVCVETPLLVPAFSSKGFGVLDNGESEIKKILLTAAEFVTGLYLISAYDVYHAHVPAPADLPMKPDLIILDSGGYEVSDDHDLSSVSKSTGGQTEWTPDNLGGILDAWPAEIPAVFVSYDHPGKREPFADQVSAAHRLFKGCGGQLRCFLLKPESETQKTLQMALRAAVAAPDELEDFDVVGVTEKELAGSHLERMVQIARFRRALDEAGVTAPIQVFGSLDPVSVCLYFVSGAEIFDGLTWIRYAFADDRCVYVHNHAALAYGVHVRDANLRLRIMSQNYYYLEDLQERMKDFESTGDLAKLPHADMLRNACDSLERRLSRGRH